MNADSERERQADSMKQHSEAMWIQNTNTQYQWIHSWIHSSSFSSSSLFCPELHLLVYIVRAYSILNVIHPSFIWLQSILFYLAFSLAVCSVFSPAWHCHWWWWWWVQQHQMNQTRLEEWRKNFFFHLFEQDRTGLDRTGGKIVPEKVDSWPCPNTEFCLVYMAIISCSKPSRKRIGESIYKLVISIFFSYFSSIGYSQVLPCFVAVVVIPIHFPFIFTICLAVVGKEPTKNFFLLQNIDFFAPWI